MDSLSMILGTSGLWPYIMSKIKMVVKNFEVSLSTIALRRILIGFMNLMMKAKLSLKVGTVC